MIINLLTNSGLFILTLFLVFLALVLHLAVLLVLALLRLDLLEELFDLAHYPGLVLRKEGSVVGALILGGLLEEGLLLLHDPEPLVLVHDQVLELDFRVGGHTLEEVHLPVEASEVVDAGGDLFVILLFSPFQDGSRELRELGRSLLFGVQGRLRVVEVALKILREEVVVTVDEKLNLLLVIPATILIDWQLIEGGLHC